MSIIETLQGHPWISLVLVGMLWGGTNPFIKRGSKGIKKIKGSNFWIKTFLEFKFLFTRWSYLVPFLINQSGSLLYILTLRNTDLSLAVPVANSLTFVFTALVGQLLGEKPASKETYIGMVVVVIGISLCVYDKVEAGT